MAWKVKVESPTGYGGEAVFLGFLVASFGDIWRPDSSGQKDGIGRSLEGD
ncbi:12091_t:CDS:2 [Rhizophagus irregularis]|nr:12091_t:CDS:2 [Rhizophagus irregularis]